MAKQSNGTRLRLDADIEELVRQKCFDDRVKLNRVCNDLLRDWLGGRVKIEGKSAGKVAAEDEGLVKQLHHIREWNSAVWQSIRALIDGLSRSVDAEKTERDRTAAIAGGHQVASRILAELGKADPGTERNPRGPATAAGGE